MTTPQNNIMFGIQLPTHLLTLWPWVGHRQDTCTNTHYSCVMADLQSIQFSGSTKKTLWQLCQLVVCKGPGQLKRINVRLCTAPDQETKLAGTYMENCNITYKTQH